MRTITSAASSKRSPSMKAYRATGSMRPTTKRHPQLQAACTGIAHYVTTEYPRSAGWLLRDQEPAHTHPEASPDAVSCIPAHTHRHIIVRSHLFKTPNTFAHILAELCFHQPDRPVKEKGFRAW